MDLTAIAHTGGPVLLWRGPDYDSLDLTGPVIANWVNKGVGLFGDYDLGEDFTLFAPLPQGLHWRELVSVLSVLLAGGRVVIGSAAADGSTGTADGSPVPPDEEHVAIVPLGHEDDPAVADADEVFVFNPPALALSTPVDEDFIDINSAIRAYPDVTHRRLDGSGTLTVDGEDVAWNPEEGSDRPAGRPQGLLVSNSTPLPGEWPQFLHHLLGGGEVLLANGVDDSRITDLADGLGVVHGTLGTWTK
ncbi:hypothetical protein [Brevibacterium atlanticum]|uniref:hypothetical protein n=1 Tax=Brevibacterium atlanticum TaxID=2697563 RepID=UPI001422148B|nr:hypothetical protein [Brevibacterium atlanticum]